MSYIVIASCTTCGMSLLASKIDDGDVHNAMAKIEARQLANAIESHAVSRHDTPTMLVLDLIDALGKESFDYDDNGLRRRAADLLGIEVPK